MRFEHQSIDDSPPCGRLFSCQTADLTGDGYPDLIVGGTGSKKAVNVLGKRIILSQLPVLGQAIKRLETNLFWYENPGVGRRNGDAEWTRRAISSESDLHVLGSALGDVSGNGKLDLIVGQGHGRSDVYWFEQPTDPRREWEKHLIADDFSKYHDLAFGDVDNDGEPEVVGLSQESESIFYYDVPADPTRSPWPSEQLTIIDSDADVEGLAIVDIDGDGDNELIAGTAIYHCSGANRGRSSSEVSDAEGSETPDIAAVDGGKSTDIAAGWTREDIATGWDYTRVAVGDIDDDGEPEVVFTEGDSPTYGEHMGRVGWFDQPDWEPHILDDDLYCPHSIQLADFDGNGSLDIYVAEMGLGENEDSARHVVFHNCGDGEFNREVVERAVPTHEARAVDVDRNSRPDVIGKSYTPDHHVDVWYNRP